MNYYFLFFSAFAVLTMPLTLRFRLRLGRRSGYRLRVQAAGLPFVRRRKISDRQEEKPLQEQDVARSVANANVALLRALLNRQVLQQLLHALELRQLTLFAHISFQDAAGTAMGFCALRTVLHTLERAGVLPEAFTYHLEADFQCKGTEIVLQGIVGLRLGSLFPTAATLTAAYLRTRAKLAPSKEEAYAAASH